MGQSALTSTTQEGLRTKLDGIVSKMVANGEPDENIRAVVDDFKGRFYVEQPKESPGLGSLASTAIGQGLKSLVTAPVNLLRMVGEEAQNGSPMGLGPRLVGRLLIDPAMEQGRKAKDAFGQGRISEGLGHGAAALLPGIGPAAAGIGEQVGSGDPETMARGVGDAGALAASGPAARLTGRMMTRAGQGAQAAGKSMFLRSAKIPESISKRTTTYQKTGDLTAGEGEIANTLLSRGKAGISRKNVADMRGETRAASQEVGRIAREPGKVFGTNPVIQAMDDEIQVMRREADPAVRQAQGRRDQMATRWKTPLASADELQTVKVAAGARNAPRFGSQAPPPGVARMDMTMRKAIGDVQEQGLPGLAEANAKFSQVKPATEALSKARQRIGHHDPAGLTQSVLGLLGMPGLLSFIQRGGPLSHLGQQAYTQGGRLQRAAPLVNPKAALLAQLLGQEE
jgi:hypothetical protein